MTNTVSLSARIAELEQLAEPLPTLRAYLADAQRKCALYQQRIAEADHAQRILDYLADQTTRVLAGGELIQEATPQPPEPHEQPTEDPRQESSHDIAVTTPETPAGTVEISDAPADTQAGDDDPSGTNQESDSPPLTQRERILEELRAHPWQTAVELRQKLDINKGTISGQLSQMKAAGVLVNIDGEYAPAGTPRTPEPNQQSDMGNPITDTITSQEESLPKPSNSARVLDILRRDPQCSWTVTMMAVEADLTEKQSSGALNQLYQTGKATSERTGLHSEYRLATTAQPAAPAAPTVPPIPTKLSPDEVSTYDALRHAPDGLTERLLVSRLNWSAARVSRAVNRLHEAGRIGKVGDVFKVIPPEYQGQQEAV